MFTKPSLGKCRLKSETVTPWTFILLFLSFPAFPHLIHTHLIYTALLASRELDSQIPLVRTLSQPLPRPYLRHRQRSAPQLIIFPCRMSLSASGLPGEEIGQVLVLRLFIQVAKEGGYAVLFQLESLFNYTEFIDQSKA